MLKEQHDKRKLVVHPKLLYTHLSTGDAQYHNVEEMALVEYEITNKSEEFIDVILVSEIEGYSSKRHDKLSLAPGQRLTCRQLPRIQDARVNHLHRTILVEVTTSYVHEEITHHIKQDLNLTLMPYNTIIWVMPHPSKANGRVSLFHHIVAWIYDDDDDDVKEMQDTVLTQLELEGKRLCYPQFLQEYSDEKKNPRELVKTIFNTLRHDKKLYYRNDSEVIQLDANEISQSVRRPGDTLRDGKGNCIDIAVLCANLIKTVKLDPIIVIKKNHAFVGWKSYSRDVWNILSPEEQRERPQYEFLDTTWTPDRNKSFEEACEEGGKLYDEILARKWLNKRPFNRNGFAQRLDIRAYYKRLEKAKKDAKFFKEVSPPEEAPSPQIDKSVAIPGNITQLPTPEIVSNTAQQSHLLASSRYIIEVEKALARIQLEINDHMTGNRCASIISLLQSISPPNLPKDENISSAESKRAAKLRLHYKSVKDLKSSIEALRMRYAFATTPLDPYETQRSLPGPDILLLNGDLVEKTERIAGELKALLYNDLLHQIEKLAKDQKAVSMPGTTGGAKAEAS